MPQTFKDVGRKGVNDNNVASLDPMDDLVLSDGVLWDVRVGTRPLHRVRACRNEAVFFLTDDVLLIIS